VTTKRLLNSSGHRIVRSVAKNLLISSDTDVGAQMVDDVLGWIAYGAYS
jgi:hypothetical protein